MSRETADLSEAEDRGRVDAEEDLEDLALGDDYALTPEFVAMVVDAADRGDAERLRELLAALHPADVADQSLRLAGPSGRYNPVTRSLEVQGVTVQLPPGLAIDEARFTNRRTEMWCLMAEWVRTVGCIPERAELRVELTAPDIGGVWGAAGWVSSMRRMMAKMSLTTSGARPKRALMNLWMEVVSYIVLSMKPFFANGEITSAATRLPGPQRSPQPSPVGGGTWSQ